MRLRLLLYVVLAGGGGTWAVAQEAPLEARGARVAVLDVALYTTNAAAQAPTDVAAAVLTTEVLHATLAELLPGQLADTTAVQAAGR